MLLEPVVADPGAPLAQAHPLAKLGGAAALMLVAFVTVDPLTPGIVLAGVLAALPFSGIAPRALALRAAPLVSTAAGIALFNAVFAETGAAGAVAVTLRLVAISLAGITALATIDPTDLGDALIEHLHAPPRFAVGALAALRLAPLFAREWDTAGRARRARGIDDQASPLAIARGFGERTFGLLVGAIRRATRLAQAMDARGFDSGAPRTLARPRALRPADWAWLAAAVALAAIAVAASVLTGNWRFLFAR